MYILVTTVQGLTCSNYKVKVNMNIVYNIAYGFKGVWKGGFLGFQETPFDSKTIPKISYLNKYTIINILASHAYLSANTI